MGGRQQHPWVSTHTCGCPIVNTAVECVTGLACSQECGQSIYFQNLVLRIDVKLTASSGFTNHNASPQWPLCASVPPCRTFCLDLCESALPHSLIHPFSKSETFLLISCPCASLKISFTMTILTAFSHDFCEGLTQGAERMAQATHRKAQYSHQWCFILLNFMCTIVNAVRLLPDDKCPAPSQSGRAAMTLHPVVSTINAYWFLSYFIFNDLFSQIKKLCKAF